MNKIKLTGSQLISPDKIAVATEMHKVLVYDKHVMQESFIHYHKFSEIMIM